jgi:hypothetical protein
MSKIIQIVLFFMPLIGFSQKDTIAHLYTFGGDRNDNAEEIQATSDGGYIVIGSTSSNSWGNTDAYLLKVDSLCSYQWSKALGDNNNEWGYSIKQTFDKGYIIAATSNSYGNGGYDAVLMKRDSLGNYEWTKGDGGIDWDIAYSVVQTYDSGYVFCGETYNNTNGFSDVYIVKTNPLGDTLWTRTYGGSLIDKGNSVIETSDSNIVVAGISNTLTDSTDIYVIKLTANGTLIWDSVYGGILYETANQLIETNDGDYAIIGGTSSVDPGVDESIYLFKIDLNGNFLWQQTYGYDVNTPGKNDEGVGIKEMMNGDLVLLSKAEKHGAGLHDISLIRVNSGGWWLGVAITIGSSNEEIPNSITIGLNGNILIAGKTIVQSNEEVLLLRIDTIYPGMDTIINSYMDMIPLNIVSKEEDNFMYLLYPNPAESFIKINTMIDYHTSQHRIIIHDVFGRSVYETEYYGGDIFVENLKQGIYFFSLLNEDKIVFRNKFLKQ